MMWAGHYRRKYLIALGVLAAVCVLALALVGIVQIFASSDGLDSASEDDLPLTAGVAVASATDFDPHGDGAENGDEVDLAWDGDLTTNWETSTYALPFETLNKPGVGLLFDLGREMQIGQVDVFHDSPGATIELRSGPSRGVSELDFELAARATTTDQGVVRFVPNRPTARYWLLWIKGLPDEEEASVTINEVEFSS